MRRYTNFSGLLMALSLACNTPSVKLPVPATGESGLQLFPSARDFDGPGQIIGVSADGTWSPVADLGSELPSLDRRREAVPAIFRSVKSSAGLLAEFALDEPVGTAVRERIVQYSVAAFGTHRDRLQEEQLRTIVEVDRERIARLLDRQERQYFIIQETVWADSVSIALSATAVDSLGGNANIRALTLRANGVRFDSASSTLVRRFQLPLRVFYKANRLVLERVRGRPDRIEMRPQTTEILVRSESSQSKRGAGTNLRDPAIRTR